jgi:hypothetical protein
LADGVHGLADVVAAHARQEAERAQVDAEDRAEVFAHLVDDSQNRAVAAQNQQ